MFRNTSKCIYELKYFLHISYEMQDLILTKIYHTSRLVIEIFQKKFLNAKIWKNSQKNICARVSFEESN